MAGLSAVLVTMVLAGAGAQRHPSNQTLRRLDRYPACARDSDCAEGRACLQYMCYPWGTSTGFRWCSRDSDCSKLKPREEGDGRDGTCFRRSDRDNNQLAFGICLKKM